MAPLWPVVATICRSLFVVPLRNLFVGTNKLTERIPLVVTVRFLLCGQVLAFLRADKVRISEGYGTNYIRQVACG